MKAEYDDPAGRGIPRRFVVMGVSGCGKSEIGRRLAALMGCRHVEGDSYHPDRNIRKMAAGVPLDDEDRRDWLLVLRVLIAGACKHGEGLVISCSALKRSYRDLLREGDPSLQFVHLEGDRELIASRMQARPNHFMPVSLLESQFRDLEPLNEDEAGIRLDIRLPPEEIVRQFGNIYVQ